MDTLTGTNRQVSKLCEVFMENFSGNTKYHKLHCLK